MNKIYEHHLGNRYDWMDNLDLNRYVKYSDSTTVEMLRALADYLEEQDTIMAFSAFEDTPEESEDYPDFPVNDIDVFHLESVLFDISVVLNEKFNS